MSFKLSFPSKQVVATFHGHLAENEIKGAFIELVESISIDKINEIIFDFSDILSYTIPKDYLDILKTITLFSETWNTNIKVFIIATNPNIRTVMKQIIKMNDEFKWDYYLFTEIQELDNFKKSYLKSS